ncbi:galactokinase [Opitutus sp. ER46]|uniref:galactokinase n=1 Tax=Opitutus sp. ER46 TaxID=2161864 RepID=UPI000D31F843|nr:galactokinase [Opitutus sp. ER46]PTX98439.1 galactokinase [Opitutus sp. ER46]
MKSALIAKFSQAYGRSPEIIARAPGRIEFIGNHTDYNGGTVLGAAIDRGVWVGLARREDGLRRFASDQREGIISQCADQLAKGTGQASWVNYPLGVIAAFPHFGLKAPGGFDYYAISDLPVGAGLSSSAAIELASALAFVAATGQEPDRETLVKVGKHAENNFVGVPCGILDQGVSGFGRKDHLVFIDCRGPRFDTVPLPSQAHFWIFNTHTKHALVDGLYAARHRECMEAARTLGVGLLVEVTPATLNANLAKLEPTAGKRARHVVEEIARVDEAGQALRAGNLAAVGRLLTASHRSSQHLFENSTPELDFLVDTLVAAPHVYGSRLTGGGFGGAVMALTSPDFGDVQAQAVADAYARKFGAKPDILHAQTGDGAQLCR